MAQPVLVTKAIIPAAGLGTRLYPVTRVVPKELLPIGSKPLIHYIVEEAVASGVTQLAIIISPAKQLIKQYFCRSEMRDYWEKLGCIPQLEFIYQPQALGLGDAISLAQEFVAGEPFAILLPDNIYSAPMPVIKQLKKVFAQYQVSTLSLSSLTQSPYIHKNNCPIEVQPLRDNVYKINHIHPKGVHIPDILFKGTGRYILTATFFEHINRVRNGITGELDDVQPLQDFILHQPLYGVEIKGKRYDCGNPIGYRQAILDLG